MKIPLVDLKRQYASIQEEINSAIAKVISETAFILGPQVAEFEKNFSAYCGTKFCVGLNSGTDALFLSFLAIGLQTGDEVITVPNTFFATSEYLGHLGVKPVFVDINPQTFLIDPEKIEAAITSKTRAIVPVHLFGQMAPMAEIMALAKKYNLKVIEDAAQAHGAMQNGKKAGNIGDIGIYSFYPGKNLGAYGDAGCIVTNNEQYATLIKKLRDHGRSSKYEHQCEAYSSRMDGLQGAILNVKLNYLDRWVEARQRVAAEFDKFLPAKIIKPLVVPGNQHAYHLYAVVTEKRDQLLQHLKSKGIEAGIHYPIPLHLQKAYAYLGYQIGSFPTAEKFAQTILSLPCFPELSEEEINYVVDAVNEFFENNDVV